MVVEGTRVVVIGSSAWICEREGRWEEWSGRE